MSASSEFAAIDSLGDQKTRVDRYKDLMVKYATSKNETSLKSFVDHMVDEKVPLAVSRASLQSLVSSDVMGALPPATQRSLGNHALLRLSSRPAAFDELCAAIRDRLVFLCESESDFLSAADLLSSSSSSSSTSVADEVRVSQSIRVARLYLKADAVDQAMGAVMRVADVSTSAQVRQEVQRAHRECLAECLDRKGDFGKASQRYYELGMIEQAALCCVLAAAGPERSRQLSTLYKDERTAKVPAISFLRKVYLERVLEPADVESFTKLLAPHQVPHLRWAVVQHNLEAASRLYENIGFAELGRLLGIPANEAEGIAAKMISEGRLKGTIDQIEESIVFGEREQIATWDSRIERICFLANEIVERISARWPELAKC